jgi:hypothetical protein
MNPAADQWPLLAPVRGNAALRSLFGVAALTETGFMSSRPNPTGLMLSLVISMRCANSVAIGGKRTFDQ